MRRNWIEQQAKKSKREKIEMKSERRNREAEEQTSEWEKKKLQYVMRDVCYVSVYKFKPYTSRIR